MRTALPKKGFTLLEIIIALGVFSVVTGTIVTVFSFLSGTSRQQQAEYDLLRAAQWAAQTMTNQLRRAHINALLRITGGTASVCAGSLSDACNGLTATDPDSALALYFWRDGTVLYRGSGTDFTQASGNRQELSSYVYYNAANVADVKNGVFSIDGSSYVIDVRVQNPDILRDGKPLSFTVRGKVWSRN